MSTLTSNPGIPLAPTDTQKLADQQLITLMIQSGEKQSKSIDTYQLAPSGINSIAHLNYNESKAVT